VGLSPRRTYARAAGPFLRSRSKQRAARSGLRAPACTWRQPELALELVPRVCAAGSSYFLQPLHLYLLHPRSPNACYDQAT